MLLIALTLNRQIDLNISCDEAFLIFKNHFNKSYEEAQEQVAKSYFCKNFDELKQLTQAGKCDDCGLTGIMDVDQKLLRTPGLLKQKQKIVTIKMDQLGATTRDCQKQICAIQVQLGSNAQIYNTIDLREAGMITKAKDQGTCGSCWAFGVTAVLESLILSDQARGLANDKSFWRFNADNLSLSEQYIASNLWGFQQYCNGGNFITAVAGTVSNFSTFDFSSNIPNNFNARQSAWLKKEKVNTSIQQNDYYIPYHTYDQSYGKVATVQIFDSQTSSIGQNPTARNIVKYFLSHGIAVSATLYASPQITYYQGNTIINIPCPGRQYIDHQVTFAGYGLKKDKNGVKKQVWVIRNSWGTNWGSEGYFYVEQGQNSLCSEMYFYTLMSKYMVNNQSFVDPGTRKTGSKYLEQQTPELVPLNMTRDYPPGQSGASLGSIMICLAVTLVGVTAICVIIAQLRKTKTSISQDDAETLVENL